MKYESTVKIESKILTGVRFQVRRMSFGRRLELTRQIKDLLGRLRFIDAGEAGPEREAESALLGAEVDREYLRWGLAAVEGFEIDGSEATPEALIETGPEDLLNEALTAVQREAGLREDERKNFESQSTLSPETKPGGLATSAGN